MTVDPFWATDWDAVALRHGTDKASLGHGYMAHYQRLFAGRILDRLLEVGIDQGASLATWAEVLPETEITGFDIDPRCSRYAAPRVRVVIADATDQAAVDETLGSETFPVIIDDGFHHLDGIAATLDVFAPRLEPGGLYVIEDTLRRERPWPAQTDKVAALLPTRGLRLVEVIDSDWNLVTIDGDYGPFAMVVATR